MESTLNYISDRIRAALADRTPLRIRGGGSKDFYGNRLDGELLDTTGLSGILSYEPTELVIGDRNTIREFCTFNLGTAQDSGVTRVGWHQAGGAGGPAAGAWSVPAV